MASKEPTLNHNEYTLAVAYFVARLNRAIRESGGDISKLDSEEIVDEAHKGFETFSKLR